MATYNKKLKTLEIHLFLDGANPITIADTADDNKATRALNEFKKYGTMHFEEDQGGMSITNAIPYESVQYIKVTETDGSIERANPYGCEGGGEPTVLWTMEGLYDSTSRWSGTVPNNNNPDYPVGRYSWNDGAWKYEGAPTNVVTERIVEIYKDNDEIKARSVNARCTVFGDDTVDAESHTITVYQMNCL